MEAEKMHIELWDVSSAQKYCEHTEKTTCRRRKEKNSIRKFNEEMHTYSIE